MRPNNFPTAATPTSEFGVTPSSARSANLNSDYLARQHYAQQQQGHASAASMAQASSPSMSLQDGHQNNHHNPQHVKSNPDVPIDPSIAASSPTYPPYSPYAQQGHDMSQYQGHAPPQGYHAWPQQYAGHPHGLPGGPYSSPGSAVSAAGAVATAGPRSSQVRLFPHCFLLLSLSEHRKLRFGTNRILTRFPRSTRLFPYRVRSSTSAHAVATRRLSECTSADGRAARRPMALSTI